MSSRPSSSQAEPGHLHGDLLKVSAYDRVASLLVALLVMVGLLVSVLFIIWLTTRVFYIPSRPT